MEKWEIVTKIRYNLELNDRVENILIKLTKKDLILFFKIIENLDN